MNKIELPISRANRLIHFGPVVLVTSKADGRSNIITVAWTTPISSNPVLIGVCIANSHYSCETIAKGKDFIVNIPTMEILDKVKYCGKISGKNADKFKGSNMTEDKAKKVNAPLIKECAAHIECRLKDSLIQGDHTIFVGEVLSCSGIEGFLNDDGIVDTIKFNLINHLGGNNYAKIKIT